MLRKRDLCPVGGEDFAVPLPNTERKEALQIACRIRRRIQEHLFHDNEGNTFYITCSVGVVVEKHSLFPDADELWRHVDMALYAAKETRQNRICCCDEMGSIKGITEKELIQE